MTTTHAFAIGARTWADGFGRFHAAIPANRNDGTGLILDARLCILQELVLRERKTGETEEEATARLRDYVVENVARRHHQDAGLIGYVEFIEYDMSGDTDPEEPDESAPAPEPSAAPDYAEEIAARIMGDARDGLPSILDGPDLRAALAQAAREGYALGFGAAQ